MSNANQKGTALVGGALSDEVLASSASILDPNSFGSGQKGLQQFYTPEQAAKLAAEIIGNRVKVLDPTAGDGSLLRFFDPPNSFGIEIDHDQVKNAEGSYNAIKGDLQFVYPLLRMGIPSWDGIVANPPFGLMWTDANYRGGKPTNSTVLTFVYANRLLSEDGQLVFICGRDRFYKQIADLPEAAGVYAVVECEDMFPGTTLPSIMAFAINPGNRAPSSQGFVKRQVNLDMIDLLGTWVKEQREEALGHYNTVARTAYDYDRPQQFETIQKEYDRRLEGRVKLNREYDALLVGGKTIQWLPSGFAQLALKQEGDHYAFHGLNKQHINYFTSNERLWNKLIAYRDKGILTVEPKLYEAVEATLGVLRKERVPLYPVKVQQRLGFLQDIEFLRCKKDDPTNGFLKGDAYRLDTRTQTIVEREERPVESKKNPGEYEVKAFEKQRKVLKITVGHHSFLDGGSEASQNIKWLIDHFDLPDPGDVATRHPIEIAYLMSIAQLVLDEFTENSRKWEAENPGHVPFTQRKFQADDIVRLVFKRGGLLSWEQGLGKTMGALLFKTMAERLGAKKVALVVAPLDLIDQWCRESKRFLGVEPVRVEGKPTYRWERNEKTGELEKVKYNGYHGQMREIQQHVKNGGEGFWITHYQGICLNGTRGRSTMLPPVTVREWEERRLVKGTDRYNRFYWTWEGVEVGNHDAVVAHLKGRGATEVVESLPPYTTNTSIRILTEAGYAQEPTKQYRHNGYQTEYGYIQPRFETVTKRLTSKDLCPQCEADTTNGWNGVYCESEKPDGTICGYAHYAVRVKPIASLASTTFRKGVVILDEITQMQGDNSKTSKALRGLRGGWWLGLTGTPIKNYIDQAYWPLWRVLGNATTRFPFDYEGGKTRFENDFAVVEYMKNGSRRENRKLLPEVSNLSMLWRLLASSSIRRRKEETGEPLVPIFYHEVKVPFGYAQAEQTKAWLKDFPKLFQEKYPEAPVVKAGMHEIMAPMLGLNWKLDYAATMPESDPDYEWTEVEGVSNFTPANLKVLELSMALAKQGRKVLVGSVLKDAGKWYADRLEEKGVKAIHILDDNGNTTEAKTRAKRVYAFQSDDASVFCAGVKAIRLGHNLDKADAVIINGLDFDYETLAQFVARVHRLTSQNPVDVFVVLPTLTGQETITTRKWALLGMKEGATELALDGRLIEKAEQQISEAEMIRDLVTRGFTVTDEAVDEVSVQEAWEKMPPASEWDAEGIIPARPVEDEITEEGKQAAEAVGAFLQHFGASAKTDQLDIFTPTPEERDEAAMEQNEAEFDAIDAAEAELAAIEAVYAPQADVPLPSEEMLAAVEAVGAFFKFFGTEGLPEAWKFANDTLEETRNDPDVMEQVAAQFDAPTVEEIEAAVEAEAIIETDDGEDLEVRDEPEPIEEPVAVAVAAPPTTGLAAEIRELKTLLDEGILDPEEFKEAKTILLARLKGGE